MITRWEELRLIALCVAANDHRAFERLILAHEPGLRQFVFNLTLGNASLTDDILQNSFIKAYLSLSTFRGTSRFKTWLYRIAINEYNNIMRRHREYLIDSDTGTWWEHSNNYSPADTADTSIDIQRCMATLSTDERIVIQLFYIDDLPIKKIAQITSFPEGTIKSHLHRAKTKMAKLLQSDSL